MHNPSICSLARTACLSRLYETCYSSVCPETLPWEVIEEGARRGLSSGGSQGAPVSQPCRRMEALNVSAQFNFSLPPNFGKRPTDLALSVTLVFMLLIVMLSLGCTMEFSKIKAHFWKPKGVAIALLAQYGIMPLTAFVLGKIFRLNNIEALAILICGCSPGGNLSNLFTLAMKGDMNLR